ncbi:MAG TPA: hypothetical protein VF060_12535 [Trebonia sp.]
MTKTPARAARVAGSHLRRSPAARAAVILVAWAAGLTWAGQAAWEVIQTWGTPTCSWPVQIRGTASPAQAGLVRCYLRALASRDTAGLMTVAADIPPVRITRADLRYSADARAGLATAVVTPNPEDTTDAGVTITYADGVRESAGITNMVAMGGPSGWRMDIGTDINPSPGPPPAVARPSP